MAGTGDYIRAQAAFQKAIEDGRAFAADTTQISAASNFNILLENSSTDKIVTIVKVVSFSGAGDPVFSSLLQNPTSNTPTTERQVTNLLQSPDADDTESFAASLKAEDMGSEMAAGDGTDTGVELTFTDGFDTRDFVYAIGPGESVGIGIPGGSLFGTGTDVKMALFCYQQDA